MRPGTGPGADPGQLREHLEREPGEFGTGKSGNRVAADRRRRRCAMTDYDKVRGFAPMLREVVRTKRMPPWHADPHYGSFVGDRSLTNEETKTLVHWIEAGAPRGEGVDPLSTTQRTWSEWTMGKPDLIVEVPAFEVPANGVVSYQYPRAAN